MARYIKSGSVSTVPEINSELEKIATAQTEFLSRSGEAPNEMLNTLDMNNNRITNLRTPVSATDAARLVDITGEYDITVGIDASAVFDNVAEMTSTNLAVGQLVRCKRYYSGGDLVDGLVYEVQASASVDGYVDHPLSNGNIARLITKDISTKQAGCKGDNVTDDTAAFQAAIEYAVSRSSLRVKVVAGKYIITDTITVGISFSLLIEGDGERSTQIKFKNTVVDKVLFDLSSTSSNTKITDMHILEHPDNEGTSTMLSMQDTLPDTDGYSHYKDSLHNCRVTYFKTAILITTTDINNGATHAFCSEPMFFHTRFKNNRVTFDVQNLQAVDITLVGTDIENDDVGETYTFFKDRVGATFNIYGGSFVGKGIFYEAIRDASSASLWQAAKFSMKDSRFEIRAPHTGTIFKPLSTSAATNCLIVLDSCLFLMFTQEVELVDSGGKFDLIATNCRTQNGTLLVSQSPTQGITGAFVGADGYYKSFGSIRITDCIGISYSKKTSSAYGTYEERYVAPVLIRNTMSNPSTGSYTIDSDGFMSATFEDIQQLGVGLTPLERSSIGYNIERPLSGFASLKLKLPQNATPSKFFMYKPPNQRTVSVQYKLYAVKDVADWATATFDVATDAIEIADTGANAGTAGYIEAPINLTSNYFDVGLYFKSGYGSWLEGRLYVEVQSGTLNGFIGVEYI